MNEKSWNHVDAAHCKLRFVLQAYALKQLIEEVGCNVEFVDYHVGAPVITENADSKNKVVRKIEKGLETFRYRAPLAHKLSFIRYKQSFAQSICRFWELQTK